MTTPIIERCARALRDTWYPEGHPLHHMKWPGGKEFWLKSARAVLETLLVPTPEMIAAYNRTVDEFGIGVAISAGDAMEAMILAALDDRTALSNRGGG